MSKKLSYILIITPLLLSSCATQTKSLILGGLSGVTVGAAAGAIADNRDSGKRQSQNIGVGAAVGIGVGLLSSYLLDKHVNERLSGATSEMDNRIQFGDVPPNPFSPSYGFEPKRKRKGAK